MSILHVWMNGLHVGTWSQPRSRAASFHYDDTWMNSAAARVLSLSLPFTPSNVPHRGEVVTSFFDNLLPDSDAIRARLRRRFGTQDESAFALLEAIGRDCVGAIQLLPDGQSSRGYKRIDATALDDNEVERVICIPVRPESPRPNR
jgi:serine/threonine-protein kinase HipA